MKEGEVTKIYLEGNTYPVREELKELGCRLERNDDVWRWYATSEETAEKARAIIKRGATLAPTSRPKFSKCQVCGVRASRYVKIYGSGECRDCLEERKMGY